MHLSVDERTDFATIRPTTMSKTRLLEAVRKLDVGTVKALLVEKPALREVKDPQGRNLLHLACAANCDAAGAPESRGVRLVELLLEQGFDPRPLFVTPAGKTVSSVNAVWFAATWGKNANVVKLLVRRGAKPLGLFAASYQEDIGTLKLLLKLGADINEVAEDETPLLHSVKWRRFKAAEFLVKAGADVNFRDKKSRTALHVALDNDFEPSFVRLLVKHGASRQALDAKGVTAELKASRKQNKAYAAALR
jgi:ankyrin repeat protein